MMALSLHDPWGWLVAQGQKAFETRDWSCNYRGDLAIHVAKQWTVEQQRLARREPFASALRTNGLYLPTRHLGCIVCVATLSAVWPITAQQTTWRHGGKEYIVPPLDSERQFGDYTPGRFAFLLTNVRKLRTPLQWRGGQKFFQVPDEFIQRAL